MNTFTQPQSEALVRLLLAARRQDGRVSEPEENAFDQQVKALAWHAEHDLHFFVVTEAAKIRNTLATHRQEFIARQCAAFTRKQDKLDVLAMLERVVGADGTDPKEDAFVGDVRKTLDL